MKPASSLSVALSGLGFAFGYLAAYFLSTVLPTRLFWYYPLARQFRFQVHPDGLAMDFYGRVLLSLGWGCVSLIAVRLLLRTVPTWGRGEVVHALLVWVVGSFLFTAGLYVFLLAHRVPIPLPIPHGDALR